MWKHSYECEVQGVSPEQIWSVWSDINRWHEWDDGIEYARMSQPFELGCVFELKPKGGPKLQIEVIACEKGRSFTDLTRFPLCKMYGHHELQVHENGKIKLKTTMSTTGPLGFLWRRLVAQKIADDLPSDTAKIVAIARSRET